MKSIKEKAEAYDKVLEWATEAHKVCDGMLKEDLEHLFPELKESEDEEVRKEIVTYLKSVIANKGYRDKIIESWIAWLEKQGQKPVKFKPLFKFGDIIKPKDPALGEPRIIKGIYPEFGYDTNNGILDFEFEDNWELVEESVSRTPADIEAAMQEVEEKSRAFTEAHNGEDADTILAEMRGEEPVNKGLEEESKEWLRPQLDKSYANYGETKMMELTHFDGYAMLDAIEFGAKWQEAKDQEIIETAIHHAYHNGRLEMKEKMMAKAIDATCFGFQVAALFTFRLPAGSYLVGSKVKVIVINED